MQTFWRKLAALVAVVSAIAVIGVPGVSFAQSHPGHSLAATHHVTKGKKTTTKTPVAKKPVHHKKPVKKLVHHKKIHPKPVKKGHKSKK